MPTFKTTKNILVKQDEDECFDPNWMDSDKVVTPDTSWWDTQSLPQLEDIEIWEVLFELSGGIGAYAAWRPYAEVYLLTYGIDVVNPIRYINQIPYYDRIFEVIGGPGAQDSVYEFAKANGIVLPKKYIWVDDSYINNYVSHP